MQDMIRDGLNKRQRQAVEAGDEPLLIVAGPGTGKTKTLTTRIAHLIKTGRAFPHEILALTFTNKAAIEMRNRVTALIDGEAPNITTFHGLCYQLLSQNNRGEIRFISDIERRMLIKQLRKSAELKTLSTNELGLEISRLKNRSSVGNNETSLNDLVGAYNKELRERCLYDFDDLLLKTRELLTQTNQHLLYKYIFVDEFQDTNTLQYELLQFLRINDNVCVIGDPLQSIYGFRGADSMMFDRFMADFPQATKIHLPTNYRSTSEVVNLTNSIFPNTLPLEANIKTAGEVKAVEVLNEYGEASWIVAAIEASIGGSSFLRSHKLDYGHHEAGQGFQDFAILYRTHQVGKIVQRLLSESGIPFQVVGEGSLYERPAIWATIQIMMYLHDPTVMLDSLIALKNFSPTQRQALLEKLDRTQKVSDLAMNIMEIFGLDQTDRNQLIGSMIRFDDFEEYMRHVDELIGANFYDPGASAVTLTTIHAAKGLEFTHVFLIATEEGILPHDRTNIDEERRLFYVATSRARTHLDILHAQNRMGKPTQTSRFIRDLKPSVLPKMQDKTMADQRRRIEKRKAKHIQGTLFEL